MGHSILSDRSSTRHVLVRRVGARTDQANLQLLGPVVSLDGFTELRDGGGKIRGEGSVNVWFQFRQVDFDQLVVFRTFILSELIGVHTSKVSNLRTLGSS